MESTNFISPKWLKTHHAETIAALRCEQRAGELSISYNHLAQWCNNVCSLLVSRTAQQLDAAIVAAVPSPYVAKLTPFIQRIVESHTTCETIRAILAQRSQSSSSSSAEAYLELERVEGGTVTGFMRYPNMYEHLLTLKEQQRVPDGSAYLIGAGSNTDYNVAHS